MVAHIASWIAKVYRLVFVAAVGGMIGANFAPFMTAVFVSSPDSEQMSRWMHGGWIGGAGLFLFGALTGRLRVIGSSVFGMSTDTDQPERSNRATATRWIRQKRLHHENADGEGRPVGVPAGVALGTVGGAFLGGLLGASFLLLWFSLTMSPFAPKSWASSVRFERQHDRVTSRRERHVATTRHPIARDLFLGPVILGGAAGAIFGGGCAARGRFTAG